MIVKDATQNYAKCGGLYFPETDEQIQGQTFYRNPNFENSKDGRILAYNGYTYTITAMQYLDGILSGSIGKGFGGFHSSSNPTTDAKDTVFKQYIVEYSALLFSLKGSDNYAKCDGLYLADTSRLVYGKPLYINYNQNNKRDGRILVYNGNKYVITAIAYLENILNGKIGKGKLTNI